MEREACNREREKAIKLLHEAEERDAILVDGSFLFVKHDPTPQFPICPVCYADGK